MITLNSTNKISADSYLFETEYGKHLFLVDGSQIFDIDDTTYNRVLTNGNKIVFPQEETNLLFSEIGLYSGENYRYIGKEVPNDIYQVSSLSLNVAQGCNMSCSYCYADEGKFGLHARLMSSEIAFKAIDELINEQSNVENYLVGFMGGEPLLNKKLIHEIVPYAFNKAKNVGKSISFSLTTNATLLNEEDITLLNKYPFVVTISIDGDKRTNDLNRQLKNQASSYDRIIEKINLILKIGKPNKFNARVTVTPKNQNIKEIVNHLGELGFDEVGISPVLVSPTKNLEFTKSDFDILLQQMKNCAENSYQQIIEGIKSKFGNFTTAMTELYRGSHKPYPCGAVANYLSINAEGEYFACHRFIDNSEFKFGDLAFGLDEVKRTSFMANNHVDKIEPCKSCWARYLCGGGCYHEVNSRGRISCDFIRDWLSFCLKKYMNLISLKPEYFENHGR